MKELKITSTLPVWIDCRHLQTECKIGFNIEMTGPQVSYGKDESYRAGPEITFRLLGADNKEIYTTPPRDATPYLKINSDGTATTDTNFHMVLNSLLYDAMFWRNVMTKEQRQSTLTLLYSVKKKYDNEWPQSLLSPPPSMLLRDLISSVVGIGTSYHVFEKKEGISSVWCKRAIKPRAYPTGSSSTAETFIIESRWTHVRKIPQDDGSVKEFKESAVYETPFDVKPKTCEEFLSDMAVAALAAAKFNESIRAQ